MEREYNWKTILFGAIPVSIVMVFIFKSDPLRGLRWFYLILGLVAAAGITYYFDKKKRNVFTSPFIVLLVISVVRGLNNLGII